MQKSANKKTIATDPTNHCNSGEEWEMESMKDGRDSSAENEPNKFNEKSADNTDDKSSSSEECETEQISRNPLQSYSCMYFILKFTIKRSTFINFRHI